MRPWVAFCPVMDRLSGRGVEQPFAVLIGLEPRWRLCRLEWRLGWGL